MSSESKPTVKFQPIILRQNPAAYLPMLFYLETAIGILVLLIAVIVKLMQFYFGIKPMWTSTINVLLLGFFVLSLLAVVTTMFFTWKNTYYVITGEDIVSHWGIFTTRTKDYVFRNILQIGMKQTLLGKLLGYATIRIEDHMMNEIITLRNISNPQQAINHLNKIARITKKHLPISTTAA